MRLSKAMTGAEHRARKTNEVQHMDLVVKLVANSRCSVDGDGVLISMT